MDRIAPGRPSLRPPRIACRHYRCRVIYLWTRVARPRLQAFPIPFLTSVPYNRAHWYRPDTEWRLMELQPHVKDTCDQHQRRVLAKQ
jgi:hypothetical protein